MEDELKKEFRERFGTETFCDNCNYVLTEEQENIFNWFIRKIKENEKEN
jgi:hypothetical protein